MADPSASQSSNSATTEEHITELVAMGLGINGFAPTPIHSAREALPKVDAGAARPHDPRRDDPDLDVSRSPAGCDRQREPAPPCRSSSSPPGTPPRKGAGLSSESTTTSRNPFPSRS